VPRKPPQPQQQTLSVRISDGMRKRLERVRQLTASTTGEPVSTSEIAKQFLESARDDRLELADLLEEPTETMVQIWRKAEAQHALSRTEWTVLAHFAQIGLDAFSVKAPHTVSRESVLAVLDAFLAVYALRTEPESPLDRTYLGNMPQDCRPPTGKGSGGAERVSSDLVRKTVLEARRRVTEGSATLAHAWAAHNLFRLLNEDKLPGPADLTRALRPFWLVLWRLAARGHYVLYETPVRAGATRREGIYLPPIPPMTEGPYTLSFVRGEATEFSVLLSFPGPFGPMYPLSGYPKINEFRAMLEVLGPQSRRWSGLYFFGYTAVPPETDPDGFWFRANDNGITFGFAVSDWTSVQTLFRRAWAVPDVRLAWDALGLEYGEL
jgi:hypothetical protein